MRRGTVTARHDIGCELTVTLQAAAREASRGQGPPSRVAVIILRLGGRANGGVGGHQERDKGVSEAGTHGLVFGQSRTLFLLSEQAVYIPMYIYPQLQSACGGWSFAAGRRPHTRANRHPFRLSRIALRIQHGFLGCSAHRPAPRTPRTGLTPLSLFGRLILGCCKAFSA